MEGVGLGELSSGCCERRRTSASSSDKHDGASARRWKPNFGCHVPMSQGQNHHHPRLTNNRLGPLWLTPARSAVRGESSADGSALG